MRSWLSRRTQPTALPPPRRMLRQPSHLFRNSCLYSALSGLRFGRKDRAFLLAIIPVIASNQPHMGRHEEGIGHESNPHPGIPNCPQMPPPAASGTRIFAERPFSGREGDEPADGHTSRWRPAAGASDSLRRRRRHGVSAPLPGQSDSLQASGPSGPLRGRRRFPRPAPVRLPAFPASRALSRCPSSPGWRCSPPATPPRRRAARPSIAIKRRPRSEPGTYTLGDTISVNVVVQRGGDGDRHAAVGGWRSAPIRCRRTTRAAAAPRRCSSTTRWRRANEDTDGITVIPRTR